MTDMDTRYIFLGLMLAMSALLPGNAEARSKNVGDWVENYPSGQPTGSSVRGPGGPPNPSLIKGTSSKSTLPSQFRSASGW